MRKTLSDRGVAALKPRPKRYAYPDPEQRGLYVRVQSSGAKSFAAIALDPNGKQVWATIGPTDVFSISDARERAREAIRRIRDGLPAFEAPPAKLETVAQIAEKWLTRHVHAKGLRSAAHITRILNKQILPRWKGRAFIDIRRSDVAELLDELEDNHGPRAADYCLAIVRGIANWYAARHDTYVPPLVRGMRRTNPKERERERVLADDELRAVWKLAETSGVFGDFVLLALLTAQRREKIATMQWEDIDEDGTWRIPTEQRQKRVPHALPLSPLALEIIRARPRLAENPFVLSGRANGHFNAFSRSKKKFDSRLLGMARWTVHDLRRTARSLMSRAGVSSDHAERVLGHALRGVEGIYDRHHYRAEKADALRRLAALIDGILHSRDNVTTMARSSGRR